ncbi:MAG TPA: GNAT family N-acetyltransferase [Dongiaceae bacterium]|jgi:putative acetyltransferase
MTLPPGIILRAGTPEDGIAIRDLHEASIRAYGISAYSAEEVESWVGVLEHHRYGEAMTREGEIFLLAVATDGALAGFCSYKADEVVGLYVAPGLGRQGIGTALLAAAECAIVGNGHTKVRIGAALSARAFYEAKGYRVVADRVWKSRGGLDMAALVMEKPVR